MTNEELVPILVMAKEKYESVYKRISTQPIGVAKYSCIVSHTHIGVCDFLRNSLGDDRWTKEVKPFINNYIQVYEKAWATFPIVCKEIWQIKECFETRIQILKDLITKLDTTE